MRLFPKSQRAEVRIIIISARVMVMATRELSIDIISFSHEKIIITTDVQLFQSKFSQILARFTAEVKN